MNAYEKKQSNLLLTLFSMLFSKRPTLPNRVFLSQLPARRLQSVRFCCQAICYVVLFLAAILLGLRPAIAETGNFPLYPSIKANVAFWESIYGRYTTQQAVLHDMDDLNIVYAVIELMDPKLPMGRQINEQRIKQAKSEVQAALGSLAAGNAPRTATEMHVAEVFPRSSRASYRQAVDNVRAQIGQKDRFYEGVVRSGRYMPYIRLVLQGEGLPLELAYLPHVESSFNPSAGSKAGAYGLWQFTRSTGKQYLTINSLVDERFDPYTSTRAAAKFLKENHDALQSWPLAMTAYNYGRAGMVRALEAHGSYEAIFQSYNQGYFKFASRNFYSEFLAAMRVAKRLERDASVPKDRPISTKTYNLRKEATFTSLARKHQMTKEEFAQLNPALQEKVLNGSRKVPANFPVRIPTNKGTYRQQEATSDISVRGMQIGKEMGEAVGSKGKGTVSLFHYTVRKGDTLYGIARRFGVTKEAVLQANNKGGANPIRVGDTLIIPVQRHP